VQHGASDPRWPIGSTSIIRPSITFSSLVWCPGYQMASAKNRLMRIQRLPYLRITGSMCNTPASIMEAFTCLPPLELLVQSEARLAVNRLCSLGSWSYLHPD
jgi:hypothetical protein